MPKIAEIDEKPPEFMAAVHEFVSKPQGYFLIAGKNGNGKTFTARAIFDNFFDPLQDKKFWNQALLNMKWQEDFNTSGETKYLREQLILAPLLVLDDVGTRKPSDAFMDFLYSIADQRYEKRKTHGTIITTNLTSQTMREVMGDAFVSRVASGICVRHDGPDRRSDKF